MDLIIIGIKLKPNSNFSFFILFGKRRDQMPIEMFHITFRFCFGSNFVICSDKYPLFTVWVHRNEMKTKMKNIVAQIGSPFSWLKEINEGLFQKYHTLLCLTFWEYLFKGKDTKYIITDQLTYCAPAEHRCVLVSSSNSNKNNSLSETPLFLLKG